MSKWKCTNKECDRCNIEVMEPVEKITVVDDEIVNSAKKCPRCGKNRTSLADKWDGSAPHITGHNVATSY